MSADQTLSQVVPEWTQGDRLRKARTLTGMTVREFAEHIGVSHGTVTSAETDARAVRPITMKAWAFATGVPLEWLEAGEVTTSPTPPPDRPCKRDESALAALIAEKSGRGATARYSHSTPGYGNAA